MESFQIICNANAGDIKIILDEMNKFQQGQLVKVVKGTLKGVEGQVARRQGQVSRQTPMTLHTQLTPWYPIVSALLAKYCRN